MKRITVYLLLTSFLFPIVAQDAIEPVKRLSGIQPIETYFEDSDLLAQSEAESDPVAVQSLNWASAATAAGKAIASCSTTGNLMSTLSPDRKYSFTFSMLSNCGSDQVLFSRGVDIRVNGRVVKNWERRKISLKEMREVLYKKGAGQRLAIAPVSQHSPEHSAMKASAASPAGISLPGWLVDILNAVISVIGEVCQFYGGDKELCDLAEKGVRLLADTTIKKAKENVFFDKYSILPTLYFSNCSRYGAKKESIESYIWTSTILQDNPTYQPHERLFLLVSQTMNANNDSRAGQAWARTVEQLPQ